MDVPNICPHVAVHAGDCVMQMVQTLTDAFALHSRVVISFHFGGWRGVDQMQMVRRAGGRFGVWRQWSIKYVRDGIDQFLHMVSETAQYECTRIASGLTHLCLNQFVWVHSHFRVGVVFASSFRHDAVKLLKQT